MIVFKVQPQALNQPSASAAQLNVEPTPPAPPLAPAPAQRKVNVVCSSAQSQQPKLIAPANTGELFARPPCNWPPTVQLTDPSD